MKILAIRGRNIASLAGEFEVDLAGGAIGQAGLFAITGPTGAGKSSLLDTLCLALFNRTPRLSNHGGVPVGHEDADEATRVRSNDVRGLLSRGTAAGFAEVDFRGIDGERYRARWEVRRARNKATGKLQDPQVSLRSLDRDVDLSSSRRTDTQALIQDRLGLDFDQFRRSVLLAQGQFAEFLKADAGARAALLEAMTGTEIYGHISRLAYTKARDEGRRLAALRQQLQALTVLEPEERAALEAQIEVLERRAESLEQEGKLLDAAERWHREASALRTDLDETWTQLSSALGDWARFESPGWTPPLGSGRSLDAAGVAEDPDAGIDAFLAERHATIEAAREADGALAAATREHGQAAAALKDAQSRAGSIRERIAERGHELSRLDAQLTAVGEWLDAHQAVGARAQDWSLLERELRVLAARSRELEQCQRRGRELEAALPASREAVARGAESLRQATEARDVAREAAREAEARRDAVPVRDLHERRALLDARGATLERLGEALRELRGLEGKRSALVSELEADEGRDRDLAEREPVLEARFAEAGAALERAKATLSLGERRAELLASGEACPLCGSVEHPYAHDAPALSELVAAQREVVDALEAKRDWTRRERASISARLRGNRASLGELDQRRAHERARLEELASAWPDADQVRGWLDAGPAESDAVDEALEAAAKDIATERVEVQTELDAHAALEAKARVARAEADRLQVALEEADKVQARARAELEALEQEAHKLGERADKATEERDQSRAVLVPHFGDAPSWVDELLADTDRFVREARRAVEEWRERRDEREESERRRPAIVAAIETAKAQRAELEEREAALATAEGEASQALARAREARAALLAGAGTGEAEQVLSQIDQLATIRKERARRLASHLETAAPSLDRQVIAARKPALAGERAAVEQELQDARGRRSVDVENHRRRGELGEDIAAQQAELDRWEELAGLIGQADGAKFRNFAQGLTLQIVLAYANHQLEELRPRYRLEPVPGHNLEMQVVDREMGDEVRPVNSLSGGETFLVSLALALGLAESTASATAVESLFIDEGFGTLDGETLELAIATLDALQASGRTIGLISHVEGLADRLGVQVRVIPQGGGRSIIRTESG